MFQQEFNDGVHGYTGRQRGGYSDHEYEMNSDIDDEMCDIVDCQSIAWYEQGSDTARRTLMKGDRLLAFIRQHAGSPLSRLFETRYWTEGEFRHMNPRTPLLKTVMRLRIYELMGMTTKQMYQYLCTVHPSNLIFAAPIGKFDDYYFTLDESVHKMEQLLMFQFDNDETRVRQFLRDLHNVIDKKEPKTNTLFIQAPTHAGKNWFFGGVVHFFLNWGQIENFKRHRQCPLQEIVDKRILLWNGPLIDQSSMGMIETLLGGETVLVNVKRQKDAVHVNRTPIIVLSQREVFPRDIAFDTRIIRYEWKSCPLLESFEKKPLPIAVYKLLEKWDIV